MAIDMNVTNMLNSYSAYMQKTAGKDADKTKKSDAADKASAPAAPKLSEKAKDLLDKLKEKYSNMDFMVADFSTDEEASRILSRGTKEYSVLFSTDELEKMAADEDYAAKNIQKLEEAVKIGDGLHNEYGLDAALEEEGNSTVVTNVSVAFKADGTAVIFASLAEVTEKQKERIQAAREKAVEDDKAEAKKEKEKLEEERYAPSKQTTIQASSYEELLEKIRSIDWNSMKEESATSGKKIDFSV